MEKVSVRFVKEHRMQFEGQERSFKMGDEVKIPKDQAIILFREGVILPGHQFGKTIQN